MTTLHNNRAEIVNMWMLKNFQRIPHREFFKNLSILMTGTAVANLIGMLCSPILTRLFTPENLGVLSLITTLANVISRISTFSYENAIVLCSERTKSFQVFFLCIALAMAVSFGLCLSVILFKIDIIAFFKVPEFKDWILLLPVLVFLKAVINSTDYLFSRFKLYKFITTRTIIDSLTANIFKISFGFLIGAWSGNLIIGLFLGVFFAGVYSFRKVMVTAEKTPFEDVTVVSVINRAKEFKKFPLYNNWAAIMNIFAENMTVLFFSALFSPVVVGLYSLCTRVVRLPMSYLTGAYQNVYLQKAAQEHADGKNMKINFRKSTIGLALLLFPVFAILAIFGGDLFAIVFGEPWRKAGIYSQIMAPGLFFASINPPSNVVYIVLQLFEVKIAYSILYTLARALSLVIGYFVYNNVLLCLAFYSFSLVIFNVFYIGYSYYTLRNYSYIEQ